MSIMHGIEYVGYVDPWTDEERLIDEEIVRCRDCKHASYDNRWCYRLTIAYEPPITPDGFCAWGERR